MLKFAETFELEYVFFTEAKMVDIVAERKASNFLLGESLATHKRHICVAKATS